MNQEIKRLGSSVLTYGVGQVLMRLLMLLLMPVFTAYLAPAEYGVTSILGILTYILVPLFSLGLGAGIGPTYFEGGSEERKSKTIYSAAAILLATCGALVIAAFFFDGQISTLAFGSVRYADLVRLTMLSACCTILAIPFMQYLQFEERARLYVTFTLVTTIVTVAASVVLIVVLGRGVHGMVEANALGQLVALVLFASPFLARARSWAAWATARELLQLGLALLPAFAFQFVLQQSNKYILQRMLGLAVVGIYTIGWTLGMGMSILVTAFGNAWYAYFMRFLDDRETARVYFGRLTTTYLLVFGGVSAMFFVFARPVVMLMTQRAYIGASVVVGFSATAQLFTGLNLMLLPGLYFEKKVKYITLVQGLSAVLAIGVNIVCIRSWGLFGAGLALAITHVMLAVFQLTCNRYTTSLRVAYEWGRIGRFFLVYVVVAAVSLWPRHLPLAAEAALSVAGALFVIVAVYRQFGADERALVREVVARFERSAPPPVVIPEAPTQLS